MRRSLVAITVLLLSINGCAQNARPQQDSTKSSHEQEIRAALCDIDSGDFAATVVIGKTTSEFFISGGKSCRLR